MNYLVTGGAGFIGSNYVRMLLSDQFGQVNSVKVLDKLTYAGSLTNLEPIQNDPRLFFIQGDICDEEVVNSSITEGDIVVHFAAESHVDRSISGPSEFMRTNVQGTQVLLSSAVQYKAKMFLHVSTDEVYGSLSEGSSVETDPLLPNSPYAASKASSDLVVRSFVQTYGLDARITRSCNNYGLNQYPEKFIPLSFNRIRDGRKIPVYGDGSNRREWIHVEDHCRAIQLVISDGSPGEIYNVGSGIELSNLELVRRIVSLSKLQEDSIEFVEDRLGHDFRYRLDSKKINDLGFHAERDLSATLEEIGALNA